MRCYGERYAIREVAAFADWSEFGEPTYWAVADGSDKAELLFEQDLKPETP